MSVNPPYLLATSHAAQFPVSQTKMPQLMQQAEAYFRALQMGVDGRLHLYHARIIGKSVAADVCGSSSSTGWPCLKALRPGP